MLEEQGEYMQIYKWNIQLQIGSDPDQLPSERQVRIAGPINLNPLLQV